MKVFIADSDPEARNTIRSHLASRGFEIVGETADPEQCLEFVRLLAPDLVFLEDNLGGVPGTEIARSICAEMPRAILIMTSYEPRFYSLRRAMQCGAREFLLKPVSEEDLDDIIDGIFQIAPEIDDGMKQVSAKSVENEGGKGKVISVFSSKGGVGKTFLTANMAVAVAIRTRSSVGIVDLNLEFGDLHVVLDLMPQYTIYDLLTIVEGNRFSEEELLGHMIAHRSGAMLLAAPPHPKYADEVTGPHVKQIISLMRSRFDVILVDNHSSFREPTLTALDLSDHVIYLVPATIPGIREAKMTVEIMKRLGYSESKIVLVLAEMEEIRDLTVEEIEGVIGARINFRLKIDPKQVSDSINSGLPITMQRPGSRIAREVAEIASDLIGERISMVSDKSSNGIISKLVRFPSRGAS